MRRRKRSACILLSALLLFSLAPAPARGGTNVYFTSVNDTLLTLSDDTMPFWKVGVMYVPYTVFDRTDLGTYYNRSRDKMTAVLYKAGRVLDIDFSDGTIMSNGTHERLANPAIVRGDVVFLPLDSVAGFFNLDYSYIKVAYGYLVRVKSSAVILNDEQFADAAAASMQQRYNQYERANAAAQSTEERPPKPQQTEPSVPQQSEPEQEDPALRDDMTVYYLIRITRSDAADTVMDLLNYYRAYVTFAFPVETLAENGDLLRRCFASGHAVAFALDASGGTADALEALDGAQKLLWEQCCASTRLIYLTGGTAQTEAELSAVGWCPIRTQKNMSSLRSGSTIAERTLSAANRSGVCSAYLGSDKGLNGSLGTVLGSLRGCSLRPMREGAL